MQMPSGLCSQGRVGVLPYTYLYNCVVNIGIKHLPKCTRSRMAQGSTKKSRNKKMIYMYTHHNDAMTSALEIQYCVVCASHSFVMMSECLFSCFSTFWCFLGPFLDLILLVYLVHTVFVWSPCPMVSWCHNLTLTITTYTGIYVHVM